MLHLNLYEWRKYLVDICTQSSTRLRFIVKRGAQGNRYYSTSSAYATQAGSAISNKRQCQQSERPSSAEDWALSRLLWHWWALKGPQWTSFYLKPCGSDIIGSSLPQEGLTSHTTHTTDHRTHTHSSRTTVTGAGGCRCFKAGSQPPLTLQCFWGTLTPSSQMCFSVVRLIDFGVFLYTKMYCTDTPVLYGGTVEKTSLHWVQKWFSPHRRPELCAAKWLPVHAVTYPALQLYLWA